MVITPKSLTITQLLSAESEQYVVPAYQRRYSWQEKQLWELLDDITLLEGSDTHLLGSIVCLTGFHKAGINELELVDGQQRLTTICILLQCIVDRLKKDGELIVWRSEVFRGTGDLTLIACNGGEHSGSRK
jgi:uncharacterized protein with ParB-like and HNH nuclease domain